MSHQFLFRKITFLTLLLAWLQPVANSQVKYDAYAITLTGDTLMGKIAAPRLENGNEDKKLFQLMIVFEDSAGDKTDYRPGEIAGFAIKYRGAWMRYKTDSITGRMDFTALAS